jgi:hypothetical protein
VHAVHSHDEVCTSDGVRHGSGRQGKGSLSKKTERRVGEKGKTPRGRTDEAAAATGPGTKTMDHHWTDGVSLTTPASGPQLIKPTPPPLDSAMSGAWCNSKRVKTHSLAGAEGGQHGRRKNTKAHPPGPSKPPPIDHRRPTYHPNPPHHRGQLKTRPRLVSQTQVRTHQQTNPRLCRIVQNFLRTSRG